MKALLRPIVIGVGIASFVGGPLYACVVPVDVENEREQWDRIEGRYVELASRKLKRSSDPEPVCVLTNGVCGPDSETFDFEWTEKWHYGQIFDEAGRVIEVYHSTTDLESSCWEPEGPDQSGTGIFFISRKPTDGRFFIHDWQPLSPTSENALDD